MTDHDCFKIDPALLPLAEALALIEQRIAPVAGVEQVPLDQGLDRVLAAPLIADGTQPPFANAAMDGVAVRFADLAGAGHRLPLVARIAAGHPHHPPPPSGSAVRIFTGGALPDGFDTVVMQEDCTIGEDFVVLPEVVKPGLHVRRAGIDFQPGDVLLLPGRRLRPQDIGIAAALGHSSIAVRRRLRIGLFSTGDELVAAGQTLAPGQIHDSNRPMLRAALTALGHEVNDLGHLADDEDGLVTAFGLAALEHDALVSSGGVSVGGEDHVRAALERLGRLYFWRLALRPGKPLALGQIGACSVIGLPGNPVSALISLLVVGSAVLRRLAGATAPPPPPYYLPTGAVLAQAENRLTFLRGSRSQHDGVQSVVPYASQDLSLLSSLVDSDGLIEVGAGVGPLPIGSLVAFHPYVSLLR